jgi:hypothetical protein
VADALIFEGALVAVAFVSMGTALESAQTMALYRTFAYTNMRDNVFGVVGGWMLAAVQGAFLRVPKSACKARETERHG